MALQPATQQRVVTTPLKPTHTQSLGTLWLCLHVWEATLTPNLAEDADPKTRTIIHPKAIK